MIFWGNVNDLEYGFYSTSKYFVVHIGTLMASIGWIQSVAALMGNATLNSIYSATLAFDGGMFASSWQQHFISLQKFLPRK